MRASSPRPTSFRIAVILIDVPPLRERGGDILALAEHFAREFAAAGHRNIIGFSASAQELLQGQPWPGNVRQLKNCIERAVAMGSGPLIDSTDIVIRETPPAGTPQASHSDLAITDPARCARPNSGRPPDESNPSCAARVEELDATSSPGARELRPPFDELAKREAEATLHATGGNVSAAARLLGMSRGRMLKMMRKYRIGGQ
jgi:DNA-binding NtrC family response regulator